MTALEAVSYVVLHDPTKVDYLRWHVGRYHLDHGNLGSASLSWDLTPLL